jgi:hypothetical protein
MPPSINSACRTSGGRAAIEVFLEQRKFAQTQAKPEALKPGSWTRRLFDLVEQGLLATDLAPVAMSDYLNPSLDTTISATGQLNYQLRINPDQWRMLQAEPELARNAANKAVRMASPVRSFTRHTSRDVKVGDVRIPEGARVMMLFASANRDHRVFENPDRFDITRHPRHHLGFGRGIHMCVGQHLAQMEMIALLGSDDPARKGDRDRRSDRGAEQHRLHFCVAAGCLRAAGVTRSVWA